MRIGLTVWLAALLLAAGCAPGAAPSSAPPPPASPMPSATPPAPPSPTPSPPTSSSVPVPTIEVPTLPPPQFPSEVPTFDECDFLPAGVDRRACTAPEPGKPPIRIDRELDLYALRVAGPIRCDVSGEEYPWAGCAAGFDVTPAVPGEDCEFGDFDPNFVYLSADTPDQTWRAGQGSCRGDPLISELSKPAKLPVGKILVSGPIAVLASANGITVWNGEARHGFAILDGRVLTW